MKKMRGFTILELMIVIVVMGIIIAIAMPSMRDFTANNRMLTTGNLFIATFHQARNEATTRSQPILIKAIGNNWQNGWTIEGTNPDGTTNTLQSTRPLSIDMTVTSAAAAVAFEYNPQGRISGYYPTPFSTTGRADFSELAPDKRTLVICDSRTGEPGRTITLTPIGRVSVSTTTCP